MVERRFTRRPDSISIEIRDDGTERISGLAAVYYDGSRGSEFRLWPGAVERIMPGAFDGALERPDDVRALFNHDPSSILGRNISGTLSLTAAADGLRYAVTLGDTSIARDVREHIVRGDVSGSSFAFEVEPGGEEWRNVEIESEDGPLRVDVREIRSVRLHDVSPVTYPAYEGTSVEAKASGGDSSARGSWRQWQRLATGRERIARARALISADRIESVRREV